MSLEIPTKIPTQHVTVRLPKPMVKAIDAEADKKGQKRSVVVAALLKWALEESGR